MKHLALVLVLAAACGKPAPAPETAEPTRKASPLGPMHDVLAPVWHMTEGPERITAACDQVDALAARAGELAAAPAPAEVAGREAAWQDGARAVVAEVEALRAACAVDGRGDVALRLKELHGGYHGLAKQLKAE